MTSRVLITNDQTSQRALIVHFSNDAATRLLKPGESVDAAICQGMCINLIESEEDYSHGEIAGDFPNDGYHHGGPFPGQGKDTGKPPPPATDPDRRDVSENEDTRENLPVPKEGE